MVTILAPTALRPAVNLPLHCFISPSLIPTNVVAFPRGRLESQSWRAVNPTDRAMRLSHGVCEAVAFILIKLSQFAPFSFINVQLPTLTLVHTQLFTCRFT